MLPNTSAALHRSTIKPERARVTHVVHFVVVLLGVFLLGTAVTNSAPTRPASNGSLGGPPPTSGS